MAIDFKKWNEDFGGEKSVEAVKEAKANEYTEVPDGKYVCSLEKLELGENKKNRPMVKAQFRIKEGKYKKQCIFYNGVMAADNPDYNGFMIHKVIEFLKSLNIFDDSEVDFDGDFSDFNDLLLDIAEEAESMKFEVKKSKDGDYSRIEVIDNFEA